MDYKTYSTSIKSLGGGGGGFFPRKLGKEETTTTTAQLLFSLEVRVSEITQLYIMHLKGKQMRCSSTAVEIPQPKPRA